MRRIIKAIGIPRLIISALFISVLLTGLGLGMPMNMFASDVIKRVGMFGLLTLAILPSIQSGTGPNFALPIGIMAGLLGMVISLEIFYFLDLNGIYTITTVESQPWWYTNDGNIQFGYSMAIFITAIVIAIPIAVLVGYGYGKLQNLIKGSEMSIAPYMGFSAVQFMCIIWIIAPFKNTGIKWPLGPGLRNTFILDETFGKSLNGFLMFNIKVGPDKFVEIPTGLLLFFFLSCYLVYVFTKSKRGTEILAGGMNPKFAQASGVNIDSGRVLANILSTVLGAVGIIVYSQSFGFAQLYGGPMMMAFPAVAAILIGGATAKRAQVSHVIIGTLLFQGLLTVALPVANELLPGSSLSEILRMIVQNGIILYALTKVNSGGEYSG
jgi:simple sugar transport system permease protein